MANLNLRLFTALILTIIAGQLIAQSQSFDGKNYTAYKPSHFRTKTPFPYQIYLSPILTVDPLGFGGKSTYGLSAGLRVNLWESKFQPAQLAGLRFTGLYTSLGYEYYPQQYNIAYMSLWFKFKTFMTLHGRMDGQLAHGYGKKGVATRFCFGFDISKVTLLLTGTLYSAYTYEIFGPHPVYDSEYANAGSIILVIPLYDNQRRR